MGDDISRALWAVHDAIRSRPLREGMRHLFRLATVADPGDRKLKRVDRIDFSADAERVSARLAKLMLGLSSDIRRAYFGLDRLNMVNGKGIEFGAEEADEGGEYGSNRAEIASKALSQIYRNIASLRSDCLLALGYLGLALRDAFRALGKKWTGPKVTIVFGHHDGDLYPLGTIGKNGFSLRLQKFRRPAKRRKSGAWQKVWPSSDSRKEWFTALGRIAQVIDDDRTYVRHTAKAIEGLLEGGWSEDAEPLAEEMTRRLDLTRPGFSSGCATVAAVRLARHDASGAKALLRKAWDRLEDTQEPGARSAFRFDAAMARVEHLLPGSALAKKVQRSRAKSGEAGKPSRKAAIEAATADAKQTLASACKHPFTFPTWLTINAWRLIEIGEKALARDILQKGLAKAAELGADGPVIIGNACMELARPFARAGDPDLAVRLIKSVQLSGSDAESILQAVDALIAAKAWNEAAALAKRIHSGEKRAKALVLIYASSGSQSNLLKLLRDTKTPEQACELAEYVAGRLPGCDRE